METCNGNQLASASDRHALIISTPAKNLAVTRVRSTGRATGHTVKGMFAVRSILERTHQPGSPARQPRWGGRGAGFAGILPADLPACYCKRFCTLFFARFLFVSERHDQFDLALVARNDFDIHSAAGWLSVLQSLRQVLPANVSRWARVSAHNYRGHSENDRDQEHRGDRFVIAALA